jgi:hypothetical protein
VEKENTWKESMVNARKSLWLCGEEEELVAIVLSCCKKEEKGERVEYLSERSKSSNLVEKREVVAAVVLDSMRKEEKTEEYLRELGMVLVSIAWRWKWRLKGRETVFNEWRIKQRIV